MPGNAITTEVVFFHRHSATVLVTDLIQQMPRGWYRGWRAVVARLDGMTGDSPRMPAKFRLAFLRRAEARAASRKLLDWPARQLVLAHGPITRDGAGAILRRAFGTL